jgi:hypothetical protein
VCSFEEELALPSLDAMESLKAFELRVIEALDAEWHAGHFGSIG